MNSPAHVSVLHKERMSQEDADATLQLAVLTNGEWNHSSSRLQRAMTVQIERPCVSS